MHLEMRVMNEHMDDDVDHIREPVLGDVIQGGEDTSM